MSCKIIYIGITDINYNLFGHYFFYFCTKLQQYFCVSKLQTGCYAVS